MSRGKIIVIVAPSGTGKSTLIEKLQGERPILKWSVSCTTRPIREGETHGVNYFFISKEEFVTRKDNNEFIEWATVHSNYYGTLKSFVDEGLDRGEYLIFDLDVQGCDQVRELYKDDAEIIFIEPPSVEELERRLTLRATDAKEVIAERVNNAKEELKRKNDFNYNVVNDDFDKAFQDLLAVVDKIIAE